MSNAVQAACWPLQMSPPQKAVLMALADNASDHGVCWPSIPTICLKTCLAKSTVITALQALEVAGLLVADRVSGRVNKYQIVPTLDLFPKEKPVRQLDRSGSRTGTTAGPNPSDSRTGPVREPDPNHKEPSRTTNKNITAALDFGSWPSEPSPQVLADWLKHRKAKRALVTETVLEAFGRELHKAKAIGWSVDDCLAEAMQRNWQGFNADWLQPDQRTRTGPPAAAQAVGKTMQGIMALEGLKSGKRVAAGRDCRGDAEALLLESGKDSGG